MIDLLIFATTIVCLYSARIWIGQRIQGISLLIFNSKTIGIKIYSLLFLPGVILHELSHFFIAALLNVGTGDISIFPSEKEEDEVRLGSVQHAKTDVLRSSFIGAAPFFVGSIAIFVLVKLQFPYLFHQPDLISWIQEFANHLYKLRYPITWATFYAILAIANTMYTSKEDCQAWPFIGFILILALGVIILSGNSLFLAEKIIPPLANLSRSLSLSFAFAILVDLTAIAALFVVEKLVETITRKRVHYH